MVVACLSKSFIHYTKLQSEEFFQIYILVKALKFLAVGTKVYLHVPSPLLQTQKNVWVLNEYQKPTKENLQSLLLSTSVCSALSL